MVGTGGVHARNIGHGYGSNKNGPLGSNRRMYNNALDMEDFESIPDEVDDVDDFVEDLIAKKVHGDSNTAYDLEPKRKDMNSLASAGLIKEKTHTTTARSTISPFSNKQLYPNGTGPIIGTGASDQAFHTSGNQIFTGSEKGWVGPHKILTDIEDDNIESLDDIMDPIYRSYMRHQKSLNDTLYKINECLRDN